MLQQYANVPVRTSAVLTTSYVAGSVIGLDVCKPDIVRTSNQLNVLVDFTIGSLTSAEIKLEFSDDGINFYQETFSSISAGTDTVTLGEHKIAATGKYSINVEFKSSYVRISAKGTGTTTNSLMAIRATVGNS